VAGRHSLTIVCRTGIAAGSPVPIELMKQLIAKLNLHELTIAYGMSMFCAFLYPFQRIFKFLIISLVAETSPVSFQTTPKDTITQRVETVGKVLPHVMAKVVDHAGNVVPVNTPGELLVSGYLVQKGYELQSPGLFAD
jgi:acyl-CoA synthetase (AMP-forming)/AMP-acid ligase II